MDVLHITHQFAPETQGGVESHVRDLVAAQRDAGQDARILTGSFTPWPQVGIERFEVDGVPVARVHRDDLYFDLHSKAWHPGVEELFAAELLRERPRLVHVHHWLRLTSNLVEIARRARLPVVVSLHDHWTSCPRAFRIRADDAACLRPLSVESCGDCAPRFGHESTAEVTTGIELFRDQCRAELAMAQTVLVSTDALAQRLAATTGTPRARYRVLPFGYARRFAGRTPTPPAADDEPFRFAFWGALAAHKGVDVLVDAFRRLVNTQSRPSELHLFGAAATAAFEADLRARADGLPVTFHGSFEPTDLATLAPHAGVFPSTCFETWGFVLDECFELGVPAVVSDLDALGERVGSGGLRARAGDAADLARKLASVCEPATWKQLRAALPPLPPTPARHRESLDWIYEEARALAADQDEGRGPQLAPISGTRRARFLLAQRESALGRVIPEGGPR